MSFLNPESTSERIITLLESGPMTTIELLTLVNQSHKVTKQGFYAALRELRKQESVILYKKTVSLNTAWISRMQERLASISHAYLSVPYLPDIFAFHDKESATFTFSNSRTLDTFWGHAQSLLIRHTPITEPIYSYDPHYWFYIARKETEERLIQEIEKSGRPFFMIAGGSGELDRLAQDRFKGNLLQYHRLALFPDPTYYVSIIGDYILEVSLDHHLAERVEKIYVNSSPKTATEELKPLLERRSKNKIKISRNASRATSLKRKFSPYFYTSKKPVPTAPSPIDF
jgi:hypothetical protein